jgi:hypothetical protein
VFFWSPQIDSDKIAYARQGLAKSSRSFGPQIVVAAHNTTTRRNGLQHSEEPLPLGGCGSTSKHIERQAASTKVY